MKYIYLTSNTQLIKIRGKVGICGGASWKGSYNILNKFHKIGVLNKLFKFAFIEIDFGDLVGQRGTGNYISSLHPRVFLIIYS